MKNPFRTLVEKMQSAAYHASETVLQTTGWGTFLATTAAVFLAIDSPDTRPSDKPPAAPNGAYEELMGALTKASKESTKIPDMPSFNTIAKDPALTEKHMAPPETADMRQIAENMQIQAMLNPAISEKQAAESFRYYAVKLGETFKVDLPSDDKIAFRDECLIGNNSGMPRYRMIELKECMALKDSDEKFITGGKFFLSGVAGVAAAGLLNVGFALGSNAHARRPRKKLN